MIHYHGGPVTPLSAALDLWKRRHAFVSFARPDQVALAAEVCQSFALDNGAFAHWTAGKGVIDVRAYAAWVNEWRRHPGFDWALIPDVVDGDEAANDRMLAEWRVASGRLLEDVPVWHMHESTERLRRLCHAFPRVALGSSGEWPTPGTASWWQRIGEAMGVACDENGRPRAKLHGLRMLDPTILSHLPLSSADSTNVARNIGIDGKWRGGYQPLTKAARALVLADRIENHATATRWTGSCGVQKNLELIG